MSVRFMGRTLVGQQAKFATAMIIFFFLLIIIVVAGLLFGYEEIQVERYEATIELTKEGDMIVSERMDMNYRGGEYRVRFWDVDYQKFPADYNFPFSPDNTAMFDVQSASVRVWRADAQVTNDVRIGYSFLNDFDELGMRIRCEPVRDQCESFFVDTGRSGNLSGRWSFEYNYTILGAVSQYSDISELNWVLFEYMEGTIQDGEVTILLPENTFTEDDLYIFGHGISDGHLEIVSNRELKVTFTNAGTSEWLELRVLMPNELFEDDIDPRNVFINDGINKDLIVAYQQGLATNTNRAITLAQVFLGLSILSALALGYLAYRNKKRYFMPFETEFEGDYLRELPSEETPAEMSYLYYFGKVQNEDVTATLLDLIRRKYIFMQYEGQELTSKDASFLLTLNKEKSQDDLLEHEKHLIDWFFNTIGNGEQVMTKAIEDYAKNSLLQAEKFQRDGEIFKSKIRNICRGQDLIDSSINRKKRQAMRFIGLPILIAVLIFVISNLFEVATTIPISNTYSYAVLLISALGYAGYISVQRRRSQEGQERFVKWQAFKNFLTDFGNFKDYPMPGIIVWEHFLVYAVSLKVADKVMEQLRVKLPMDEEMARQSSYMGVGYGRRGFYYGAGFTAFNQSVTRARTNAAKKISSAKSSGSGRGGGFSGGSSFGGGGGGGRSR